MAFAPIAPIAAVAGLSGAAPATAAGAGTGTVAGGLGNLFTDSLQAASQAQGTADGLMAAAATGELTDLTSVMSAMTEAQLATQLTVALRNKAVESFNEVMRMQL